ncbi:MAG: hypothetical protein ACXVJB_12040 [Mucilaginibacter sp.]
MQDREFDDVFRNKLDGFEAEPSAKVWVGIDATLDEKSRKKAIMPWLSIAASIIVLVSAGILFIPKKTSTKHHTEGIVKVQPAHAIAQPKQETAINTPALQTQIAVVPATVKPVIHHTKKIEKVVAPIEKPTELIAKTEIIKPVEQPVLAAVPEKQQQVTQPVVPGNETPLTVKQDDNSNTNSPTSKPALIARQQTPVTKPAVTASPKKHGIRNFGDLVNLVVAKVDKRKDKGLEFSGDDDDESVIAEVNKGIQRIKNEEKAER